MRTSRFRRRRGRARLAQAGAAEIETEHGESEAVQSFHGVEDDFVVQRAAEHGMGMADEGGVGGVRGAGVEQGFEASGGAVEEEGADCGGGRECMMTRIGIEESRECV